MTAPTPFAYAMASHERRHSSCGYNPYDGYKQWLRDEFTFRCVYCLERELWYPDQSASFSVDHVVPQSEDARFVCDYTNLVYACTRCNAARQDVRVLDPTAVAFGNHLRLGEEGILIGLTEDGQKLINQLHLIGNRALATRRKYLTILALREKFPTDSDIEKLFLKTFGFPDDMPDLRTKRPPHGNAKPGSEQSCYFARNERKELPHTY